MYTEEQLKPYIKDLEKLPPDESLIHYIEKNKHTENFEALVEYCCNIFLEGIQRMFLKYDKYFDEYKNKEPKETNFIKLYLICQFTESPNSTDKRCRITHTLHLHQKSLFLDHEELPLQSKAFVFVRR